MQNQKAFSSTPAKTSTDWFKVAEYTSVVGSTIGSLVAAAWYQQMLYAATPITAALWLNLINRQRFEQQIRHYTESTITDVHLVVQSLHEQMNNFPSEQTELDPITEVLTELQRVTQSLEHDVIRQQDWEVMNVRIKLIEEKLEDLKTTPVSTSTSQVSASTSLSDRQKLEQIHRQVVKLDQQNREIVKPYLQRLRQAIKKLQKT